MESVTHRVVHTHYGVVKFYIHLVSTRSAGIYYSIIIPSLFVYRIAGNFRGTKYSWFIRGSAILIHFVGNIFVVGACTAGKGRQGRFIRG